ncbi:MAG: lamin tail domain-containing protein, partial [Chloroflexi bacterium]|nr:lamin tail domain-containing protein [Chloroflexota bacterium]
GGSPGAANRLPVYTGPVLNEGMARNESAPADWIELRNPAATPFDLSGMSLSVDQAQAGEWMFPAGTILPGNSYLVIWCDDLRPVSLVFGADLNVGKVLSGESGGVYLFNTAGELVDGVEYGFQIRGLSIGRVGGQWKLLAQPTPGQTNASAAVLGPGGNLKINEWMANPSSGDDWFELYNPGVLPVELSGSYLTDDPSLAGQAKFQVGPLSFIAPKSWVTFVADGHPSQGRDHVNFALDGEGEALGLYTPGLAPIDEVYFAAQALGVSEGRLLDGGASIVRFPAIASPGRGNYLPLTNIVFSEVLTHTDPPLEDAVELHNIGTAPLAVGGWYLSNTPNDFKRYRIEESVVIPPGGFHVFYEGPLLAAGSGGSAYLFRAEGGEVYLSQADAAGNLTGYKAVARFGPIENGISIGRYVTSVGIEFVALSGRTLGQDDPVSLGDFRSGTGLSNAFPRVGPVVISELMYHPPGESGASSESGTGKFIELHNITDSPAALYDPNSPRDTWRLAEGIEFTFPTNVVLAPRGFLLVVDFDPVLEAGALAAFREKYAIPAAVSVVGPFQGRLSNEGESIELYKFFRPGWPLILVDRVAYSNQPPWPAEANGTGPSLQRKAASEYGNDPVNWKAEAPSPGRADSGESPNASPVIESILVSEGKAAITWQAVPGKTYSLQYKTSLDDAVWKDLGEPVTAGANRVSREDGTFGAAPQRFYRVICPATP